MNQEILKSGKFVYEMDWPEHELAAFRPLIDSCEYLVPSWCNRVRVLWCPKMNKAYATMNSELKYRRATLNISPCLSDLGDEERQKIIRHEIIHISTIPLVEFAEKTIKNLAGDRDDIRKVLNRELEQYHEGMTEDLAHCLRINQ